MRRAPHRPALDDAVDEILERSDAARGDDRHIDGVGDRARQREIEAGARAVAIHAGEQDFPRAARDNLARPVDRIEPRRRATAVRVHLPCFRRELLRIDRGDDALCAEAPAAASKRPGFFTPAVLMLTLSAPALSSARMSSIEATPPPTVSGMNT
jgi:hypothetical protein